MIMPVQSQGIIARYNVSVAVPAFAYFRVVDAVRSVVAINNVYYAIEQIAQTTVPGGLRPGHPGVYPWTDKINPAARRRPWISGGHDGVR